MNSVHLVIHDLFVPKDFASEASRGLSLSALEKLLGRGHSELQIPVSPENFLCELFGVPGKVDVPIAPISAAFDGLAAGCWLRADPVYLHLQRDQMLMANVQVSRGEAAELCASLNEHFAGQGMEFIAPHPQRWYVRLGALPRIRATPLSQVIGGDVRRVLPTGEDASHWHQVFNEVQMVLHAHPLNEAREARGVPICNSLWFWGGGCNENVILQNNHDVISSDDVLAEMFASGACVPFTGWPEQWQEQTDGKQLLVWSGLQSALQRGDLAAWRFALQEFETCYARPLWLGLRTGRIAQIQIDVLSGNNSRRLLMTRGDTMAFWRGAKHLAAYSVV